MSKTNIGMITCASCGVVFVYTDSNKMCDKCQFKNTDENVFNLLLKQLEESDPDLYNKYNILREQVTKCVSSSSNFIIFDCLLLGVLIEAIHNRNWWFELSFDQYLNKDYRSRVRFSDYRLSADNRAVVAVLKAYLEALSDKK